MQRGERILYSIEHLVLIIIVCENYLNYLTDINENNSKYEKFSNAYLRYKEFTCLINKKYNMFTYKNLTNKNIK